MKFIGRVILLAILILILSPIFVLGYFGFVPGISSLFGSDKPRDLGVKFVEQDRVVAHAKSGVQYEELPANTPAKDSIQRSGTHEVDLIFTSAQATALMNSRPWKYWPYTDVQVKFNSDGSAEVSGRILKDKLPGYAAAIGIPEQAVTFAMKFLPVNPVFYLKLKASLTENKVGIFDPQKFEIGRVSLPIATFLSLKKPEIIKTVQAVDIIGMAGELSKLNNKKAIITEYINSRLYTYQSFFYAKSAYFDESGLVFKGRLADKEATVR